MEILIKCPHCRGRSGLIIKNEAQVVSCGFCDELLFEYEPVADQSGVVYVLTNSEFPDLVKVGCTRRSVTERARELESQTGVPGTFVVEAYFQVEDPFDSERIIHERLAAQRLEGKEFFRVSASEAIQILTDALGVTPVYRRLSMRQRSEDRPDDVGPCCPTVDWRLAK